MAAEQADREVPEGGHDGGAVSGPDLGVVFPECDVADPVQPVLDAPVSTECVGEFLSAGLVEGQVGDDVDRFGAPPASSGAASLPGDLQRQPGPGNRI